MSDKKGVIEYRRATSKDIPKMQEFVDFWLSGRARAKGKNGGNDYFVNKGQHKSYLKSCLVMIATDGDEIVGWGVKWSNNVMIHLLVSGNYRGRGIGATLVKKMNPDIIRSKSDQQTGDPSAFYEKMGYKKIGKHKVGRKKNIDLMTK